MADEEYIVAIRGDIRDLDNKLNRIEREARQTSNNMARQFEQAGRRMERAFAGLRTISVAAGAAAVGFGVLARRSLEAVETIQDLSDRANVSAEFLQELRAVTNQSGASARDFDDAISRLNRRLGLFQQFLATGAGEAGPAANAFRALGLEADIVSGRLSGTEDVFMAVVEALQEVENQSQRSALASQLFGEDSGPRLVALLDRGVDGIRALAQEARDMGLVLENELVANAAAASDQLEILQNQFSAEVNRAIAQNAEGIVALGTALANLSRLAISASASFGTFLEEVFGGAGMVAAGTEEGLQRQIQQLAELRTELELFTFERTGARARPFEEQMSDLERTIGRERLGEILRSADGDRERQAELVAAELYLQQQTLQGQLEVLEEIAAIESDRGRETLQTLDEVEDKLKDSEREMSELAATIDEAAETRKQQLEESLESISDGLENIGDSDPFVKLLESAMTLSDAMANSIRRFEDSLVQAVTRGRFEIADLANYILEQFARVAIQESITGPITRIFRSAFGASKGPGKSTGGQASGMTLVGEKGPELVNLGQHANVMTANLTRMALAGAMGARGNDNSVVVRQDIFVDARGATGDVEGRVRSAITELAPVLEQRAAGTALRALNTAQLRGKAI